MLWMLFGVNAAGTVYGYVWYWEQIEVTVLSKPAWYLLFVPDSPTASLLFTFSLLYLFNTREENLLESSRANGLRSFIEAFALITSFKYGIWAVAMIFAGAAQGDGLVWQDWMLTASHLGMAAEALLYGRFYRYGWMSVALVAIWAVWNDFMDYHRGIFPWLPLVLEDDLGIIEAFTVILSLISIVIALLFLGYRRIKKKSE